MKRRFVWILILAALQGLIHNIGHPVTPSLVMKLGIPDYMFGVFFAMMALGMMIGAPIVGALGDKIGKVKLIYFGLLVYSFGQAMFGIAGNMWWMTFFRFVSGVGVSAIVTLFVSHVIQISPIEKQQVHLGIFSATLTLFASLGYGLGGILNTNPWFISMLHTDVEGNVFILQGILNTLYAVLILFTFHEDEVPNKDLKKGPIRLLDFRFLKEIRPAFLVFLIAVALMSMARINLSKYIDVYVIQLQYGSDDLGAFVSFTGILSVISGVLLVPLFHKLNRHLSVMIFIQIVSAIVVFFVFRQSNLMFFLYSLYSIYVLLTAVYVPFEQTYIGNHAREGTLGAVMGLRQSFLSIGMVIGPILGGVLYNADPILVFDTSAILFLIAAVLLILVSRMHLTKTTNS